MKKADGKDVHEFFRSLCGAWQAVEMVEETIHQKGGLTGAQVKNIAHLLSGGPMTVSDLAFDRGVSRQSVQVAVLAMVKKQYVILADNPRHKKAKLVVVTELGREKYETAQQAEYRIIEKEFPDLDRERVEDATKLLREVRMRLKDFGKG